MPRKTLFSRTHRQDKDKGFAKSRGAKETVPPQSTKPTAVVSSWTEAALEKANMAVLYDFTGSPKQALDAYNEAIGLLDKVFGSVTDDCVDQTRLKKIVSKIQVQLTVIQGWYQCVCANIWYSLNFTFLSKRNYSMNLIRTVWQL
jgi:hypothetical protein